MRIKKTTGSIIESKQQSDSKPKCDWLVHLCMNGVPCDECGKVETSFIPYACNAHTHGMTHYGHLEFQMVLAYSPREIMYILNTLGLRVQAGERFSDGDYVHGIFEDCDVKLVEFQEDSGRILRVIVPDKYNRFLDDPLCAEEYRHQLLPLDELYVGGSKN